MSLKRARPSSTGEAPEEPLAKQPRSDAPTVAPFRPTQPGTVNIVPRPMPPRAFLSGQGAWGASFRYPLKAGRGDFSIGRAMPDLDIDMRNHTTSLRVSHRHCVITYNPTTQLFTLVNHGVNGTRVNDEIMGRGGRHGHRILNHGDVLCIGDIIMTFEYVASSGENPSLNGNK